jgi:hypothetical protein
MYPLKINASKLAIDSIEKYKNGEKFPSNSLYWFQNEYVHNRDVLIQTYLTPDMVTAAREALINNARWNNRLPEARQKTIARQIWINNIKNNDQLKERIKKDYAHVKRSLGL